MNEYISECIAKAKYQLKMLKHRPKMIWDSLWVRQDEFHSSLDMNVWAMLDMNKEEIKTYNEDLIKRRNVAHKRHASLL